MRYVLGYPTFWFRVRKKKNKRQNGAELLREQNVTQKIWSVFNTKESLVHRNSVQLH